jgi:adenylate cyclase
VRAEHEYQRTMRYSIVSADGQRTFQLQPGATCLVGRAPTSDLSVVDPTISRKHAEVEWSGYAVRVRDLGSSNGTFVNGARVETATLAAEDVVTFGKVEFRLRAEAEAAEPSAAPTGQSTPPGAPILRQLAVSDPAASLAALRSDAGTTTTQAATPDKSHQKLATLLEVAKGLGRSADIGALLEQIATYAYQILEVDRVAILLTDANGELVPRIARDKNGSDQTRAVPRSIAYKAVTDRVAILSDNAGEDTRFGGQSILMQQIRSAICCPLVGSENRVLGVLYVDNVTSAHRFSDQDLEFCVAFGGIAAVAIENGEFAQRIQRELLTRSNFERFFTPQLARRIAESAESVKLGGEKRTVAVLFSDIRGFTALSETMRPDAMATLLTEYFTEMVDCVFRHDGTLDKFIGDAVMAQWGAPLATERDADNAMQAALDMMRALETLNARWRSAGRPELRIGVGLNYGEAFAGNIGSERRLEFTVIGDTVNTASRLCGAAGPGEILVSDSFRQALHAPPELIACPPMSLKNKSAPASVFRVRAD